MEVSNGRVNTSKVYYLNDENRKKIKNLSKIAYSKDKKYAINYTDEDFYFICLAVEYLEEYVTKEIGFSEDTIYDNILAEANIAPQSMQNMKFIMVKLTTINMILLILQTLFLLCVLLTKKIV